MAHFLLSLDQIGQARQVGAATADRPGGRAWRLGDDRRPMERGGRPGQQAARARPAQAAPASGASCWRTVTSPLPPTA